MTMKTAELEAEVAAMRGRVAKLTQALETLRAQVDDVAPSRRTPPPAPVDESPPATRDSRKHPALSRSDTQPFPDVERAGPKSPRR